VDKITSLVEARKAFATQEQCEKHLREMRWSNGVTCPRCGSKAVTYMASRHQWQCECRYQFSVTSGTVFHKTHMDLPRWLMAIWLVCHSPKGISSKQIERELGVTYKTAWYMTRRIRLAIQRNMLGLTVSGVVELDDSLVKADGGQVSSNTVHPARKVLGMVSRTTGAVKMVSAYSLGREDIKTICASNLSAVKTIYTDGSNHFATLCNTAPLYAVNHSRKQYVIGEAHVNHVENMWSLFKRGLMGVYHHVSAKYLQEYLDEFAFRQSNRTRRESLLDLVLASCGV